jgi:threonine/homoserine/homoserine lactone efflux protein
MKYISYTSSKPPTLLRKTVAIIATAAVVTLGLMFSAVLLAALLVIGVAAFAWLWWKTREARKRMRQMQEQMQNFQARSASAESDVFQGEVIEGEVIRRNESRDDPDR